MDLLRMFIAMVGPVVAFVGLIQVWAAWLDGQNRTPYWITTAIGAVMFIQAIPLFRAAEKEERKKSIRDSLKKKRD